TGEHGDARALCEVPGRTGALAREATVARKTDRFNRILPPEVEGVAGNGASVGYRSRRQGARGYGRPHPTSRRRTQDRERGSRACARGPGAPGRSTRPARIESDWNRGG